MSHISIVDWGVLAVAVIVLRIAIGGVRARKRSEDFAGIASELGFSFTPWLGPASATNIGTELFRAHAGGTCKNVMTGRYASMEVQLFEFHYMGGSAGNSTSSSQTVAVYTQNVDLPLFTLQPKNVVIGLIDRIQDQRVDLENPSGVSRHYMLHGPEKERIQALFNPSLLSFVEGLDRSKGWHIQGAGKNLVIYRYQWRAKPEQIRDFLQETSSLAQTFLNYCGATRGGVFVSRIEPSQVQE